MKSILMKKSKRKNHTPDDEQQNGCEPSTNDVPKPKKIRRSQRVPVDEYRGSNEIDEHWNLRRMFIEKHHKYIPADELECLSQLFMNIKLIRCCYAEETMKRIAELSEGISTDFFHSRSNGLQRTLVPASRAAASFVQSIPLNFPPSNDARKTLDFFQPIHGAKTLSEMLRNVIVLDNSYTETVLALHNLCCGLKITITRKYVFDKVTVYVKLGGKNGFTLGSSEGSGLEAENQAKANALEFLKKYCYSLVRKPKIPLRQMLSRTQGLSQPQHGPKTSNPLENLMKLNDSNIGFKMMTKLGWAGGSLGARDDGIVDPVEVKMKDGRGGIGHQTTFNFKHTLRKLKRFRDESPNMHLVFSPEFTKKERAEIHRMAFRLQLRSQSIGSEKQGARQLVVFQREVSNHEKLRKVLIEKDRFYCESFEVTCPTETINKN